MSQVASTGYSPYAISKFAERGLSETLQSELVGTKVSVLVVHPGGVKTNIIRNAPDLDESQRDTAHQNFSKFVLLSTDEAARQIACSAEKEKLRYFGCRCEDRQFHPPVIPK